MGRYGRRCGLEPTKVGVEMGDGVVQCDLRAQLSRDGLRLDELAHPNHVLRTLTRQKPGGVGARCSAVIVLRTSSSAG